MFTGINCTEAYLDAITANNDEVELKSYNGGALPTPLNLTYEKSYK